MSELIQAQKVPVVAMADYVKLRAYRGKETALQIIGKGIAGLFRRDDADVTATDNGGTVIIDAKGRRWKREIGGDVNAQWFGFLPVESGASDSAVTAAALERLRVAAEAGYWNVYVPAGTYVLPPGARLDADYTVWEYSQGAVLKLHATQATNDFLVFNAPVRQRVFGLRVDANRAGQDATAFGGDHCAVLAHDAAGCLFDSTEIMSSPGKGFALVSSSGVYTRDVTIRNFKGEDCHDQVLIIDGNNITGLFDRIVIDGVRIGATSHGGLVINDGAHSIEVSNVLADVQNSTWDAVAIRDSWDIQLVNVRGKRGRSGVSLERLNGYCGRVQMDNVIGEFNTQNGVIFLGAEDVTGGVVVGRNNGGAGINIAQTGSAYRCKRISIANPAGYDDQAVPTQDYGILVQGVDTCRLAKHLTYGNTTRNVSINRAVCSDVDVEVRQVASGSTGSIAAGTEQTVTLNWPFQFDDASVDIESVYVFEGTSSLALSVTHVVAITQVAVQVKVKNLGSIAHTGTLTVIGKRSI